MLIPFVAEFGALMSGNLVTLLVFELILFMVSALFIYAGAKVAQVVKASYGHAFLIAVVQAIIVPLLLLPFAGLEIVALVLSLLVNLAVIKLVFSTGWRKSIVTWVFSIIASVIAGFLFIMVISFLV